MGPRTSHHQLQRQLQLQLQRQLQRPAAAPRVAHEQLTAKQLVEQLAAMAGLAINPVQFFRTWLLEYCITIGSETTFLSALCVIQSPSYSLWSITFLLDFGLTDLGHFGRYFGQNKEIVSVFNGSVVCFDVGIGLTFLGRCCSNRHGRQFQLLCEKFLAVEYR
jgi:hypothetical protein